MRRRVLSEDRATHREDQFLDNDLLDEDVLARKAGK
jgi:hypothetical protein